MVPPYDRLCLLAAGGSEDDEAGYGDPASDRAQVIEVRGGTLPRLVTMREGAS